MKVLSKYFRCSFVLLLTLIVAVSAAIGVSADSSTLTNYIGYDHIYKDSQGVIVLSKSNLKVIPLRVGSKMTDLSQATMLGFTSVGREPLLFFIPEYYSDNITYKLYIAESSVHIEYNQNNEILKDQVTSNVGSLTGTYTPSYFDSYYLFHYGMWGMTGSQFFQSYTYTSNYTVYDSTNNTIGNIQSPIINPNYNLDDAIGTSGLSTDDLINAIDTALKNNENIINLSQKIDILISLGSNYNQIDSNLIGNLENAENQLSSAEDALENKSQLLKDSVASQWSTIQSTSKTFITNIAPAAAAVGTVTTQIMDAAPEEVKGLFVTIPLLIFIGWLIGRIRGD